MSGRDEIAIEGLRIDCIVGVYPRERHEPQPLLLDVHLRLDTEEAGRAQALRATVDYAEVSAQLAFVLRSGRFRMLETAAQALLRLLLLAPQPGERRAAVEEAAVRLCKPEALGGNGRPSLTVRRDAAWARAAEPQPRPFGTVDTLLETRDAHIRRLNLGPGQGAALQAAPRASAMDMVLGAGLLCQGRLAAPGASYRWPPGAALRYDNPTEETQSVLRVEVPSEE